MFVREPCEQKDPPRIAAWQFFPLNVAEAQGSPACWPLALASAAAKVNVTEADLFMGSESYQAYGDADAIAIQFL
jgi:hypothetical protein